MEYDVGDVERLEMCIRCLRDFRKLEEFLDYREHSCDLVALVVNCFPNNVLPFKELMRHQLTVVFLQMREYARHGVVYGVCRPVADIRQISFLNCANDFFTRSCSAPVTSRNRRAYLVCTICILEFVWVVMPSIIMREPG